MADAGAISVRREHPPAASSTNTHLRRMGALPLYFIPRRAAGDQQGASIETCTTQHSV
jgi:hypothetical protein